VVYRRRRIVIVVCEVCGGQTWGPDADADDRELLELDVECSCDEDDD
jgi:hypothetical protein